MGNVDLQFYLASGSPRRVELLTQLGYFFDTFSVDICEEKQNAETPIDYVSRLAQEKSLAGFDILSNKSLPVLGADTIVVLGDQVMVKPKDQGEHWEMMRQLSGKTHSVYTAVAICSQTGVLMAINESQVTMRVITDEEISVYWATGEPCDKAGGYAVQGIAAVFISNIQGSYSGIMGLPLFETAELLTKMNIKSHF